VPIRRVGFDFSRHGYLVSWPLKELVDEAKLTASAACLAAGTMRPRRSHTAPRATSQVHAGAGRRGASNRSNDGNTTQTLGPKLRPVRRIDEVAQLPAPAPVARIFRQSGPRGSTGHSARD
jgi:hypothetical protein